MRSFLLVPSALFLLGSFGCQGPAVNTVSFQRQRLDAASHETAYAAAERAVGERFRVSGRDPQNGVIRGTAYESAGHVASRGVLGERLTLVGARRTVTVRVRDVSGDVEVYCRVRVQENTADSVRMLTRENTISDQPHDTPADREAGTSRAQNAVWKNRSRDRAMEREILASIREILQKNADGSGR